MLEHTTPVFERGGHVTVGDTAVQTHGLTHIFTTQHRYHITGSISHTRLATDTQTVRYNNWGDGFNSLTFFFFARIVSSVNEK